MIDHRARRTVPSTRRPCRLAHAAATLTAVALGASAGAQTGWNAPVDGSWFDGSNWDTMAVPSNTDAVVLGLGGAYTVSVDGAGAGAGSLSITNPDATLALDVFSDFSVFGNVLNHGTIVVNPQGSSSGAELIVAGGMMLSGSGSIVLNSSTGAQLRTLVGSALIQNAGHTFRGSGEFQGEMINRGLVSSESAGRIRFFDSRVTNNAVIEAVGGSVVEMDNVNLTQGAGAQIRADGPGSFVQLSGVSLTGGVLNATNGASIDVIASSSPLTILQDAELNGVLNVRDAGRLWLSGTFQYTGVINVVGVGSAAFNALRAVHDLTLSGPGEVVLQAGDGSAVIETSVGATLTNAASHTIRGAGNIRALVVNDGLVSADVPGELLVLTFVGFTNNSTIEAVGGGGLRITNIPLSQDSGAQIRADGAGSRIELVGPRISGGALISTGTSRFIVSGTTSELADVDFSGVMEVAESGALNLKGSFTNDGAVTVNPDGSATPASVIAAQNTTIDGGGSITLNAGGNGARLITATDATLTVGPDQTVHGRGQISAEVVNNGLVSADVDGATLELTNRSQVNQSRLEAVNGATLEIDDIAVTQGPTAEIVIDGAGSTLLLFGDATIVQGDVTLTNGGRALVRSGSATLDGVTLSGPMDVEDTATLVVRSGLENNGVVTVSAGDTGSSAFLAILGEDVPVTGTGRIVLNASGAGSVLAQGSAGSSVVLGTGQTLQGRGTVLIPTTVSGTVQPGTNGVGTMSALFPVTFTAESNYDIEIAGTSSGQADVLSSSSTIDLDGTVRVAFADAFTPSGVWVQTVMTGASIGGQFRFTDAPAPPPGLAFRSFNTGVEVRVGWVCPVDRDVNAEITILDLVAFINAWSAMDPDTDFDSSGDLNIFDVVAFISAWSAGCG